MWNDAPPRLNMYNASNFPYRYQWTEAAIGFLLKLAAHRYRRNALQYDAGGVKIADQDTVPAVRSGWRSAYSDVHAVDT
jgi:hypothetical protein